MKKSKKSANASPQNNQKLVARLKELVARAEAMVRAAGNQSVSKKTTKPAKKKAVAKKKPAASPKKTTKKKTSARSR